MLGLKRGTVELSPHCDEWDAAAADTVVALKLLFGEAAVDIQHVGSTSIKTISAKPILDIAVAVRDFADIEPFVPALAELDLLKAEHPPENDVLFVKRGADNNSRTHHVHVVRYDSDEWTNYLNFRDYLNSHPTAAAEYGAIKSTLATKFANDRVSYTEGKADFIKGILRRAKSWTMLGKTLTVTVDRPSGSKHPRCSFYYPVNYGFVKGIIGGDGAEQDAYILGVDESIPMGGKFTGVMSAVVYRLNDVEDKWVVTPEGMTLTVDYVSEKVNFQEQFFTTEYEVMK